MATRSLMALDYSNYHSNNILKKHARNRPLGAIEQRHNYVPPQPVLSCRTVDIDLLGTRTYRPKSTVDILEEQQRLIRTLRSRAATSAPPRPLTEPAPRALSDGTFKRVNIEVKGRPFTSQSQTSFQKENKTEAQTRHRPKTAGRLKNIQPATDSFMVIKVDQDLLESSQNNRELTSKLHAYWRSDPQSLATGRFVRGQKRPDDVPPTLDAWLTFGGAAGEDSNGVIDAFASFKNSEEYYNIEGSVGSRVAQQLQKGDKIRIGINGVVQSHDFRIKKWSKDSSVSSTPQADQDRRQTLDGVDGPEERAVSADVFQGETQEKSENAAVAQTQEDADEEDTQNDLNGDFKELLIGDLDELLGDSAEANKATPPPGTDAAATMQQQSTRNEKCPSPAVIVPLSWDDQCNKPDVKVIQPTLSPQEHFRPVMSETFPVRFEKLISEGSRPRLAQARKDGYKIKQRPLSKTSSRPGTSGKVKVVYIDPLTVEDENKVNTMSVEEIVSCKMESRDREGTRISSQRGHSRESQNSIKNTTNANTIIAINDNIGPPVIANQQRVGSAVKNCTASGGGGGVQRAPTSRPSSHHSAASEHGRVSSPKLKTLPVHPAALHQNQADLSDLSITANNRRLGNGEQNGHGRSSRSGTPSRNVSSKAANQRINSSHGSPSIKAVGPNQQPGAGNGEAEYIKITSQLKMGGIPFSPLSSYHVAAQHNHHHQQTHPYEFSPGSNTPRDLDYQEAVPGDYYHVEDQPTRHEVHPDAHAAMATTTTSAKPSQRANETSTPAARVGSATVDPKKADVVDTRASTPLSESPPATTVAISIPTADELSDREESPSHSPARGARLSPDSAALTPIERRGRDLRNEQIDQITDLIGGNIVNHA